MYQIAIFKIQPEPESTGYQANYPCSTRCLITIKAGDDAETVGFVVEVREPVMSLAAG